MRRTFDMFTDITIADPLLWLFLKILDRLVIWLNCTWNKPAPKASMDTWFDALLDSFPAQVVVDNIQTKTASNLSNIFWNSHARLRWSNGAWKCYNCIAGSIHSCVFLVWNKSVFCTRVSYLRVYTDLSVNENCEKCKI